MKEKLKLNLAAHPLPYMLYLGGPKNEFVGIDTNSGGYPYATSYTSAGKFESIEKALGYMSGPDGIAKYLGGRAPKIVKILSLELEDCSEDVEAQVAYEREIAAVKAKYGKK